MTPDDLIDIAAVNGLHYHAVIQEGVFFHLMGALREFGKLGVVCVASSPDKTRDLYARCVKALDAHCGNGGQDA